MQAVIVDPQMDLIGLFLQIHGMVQVNKRNCFHRFCTLSAVSMDLVIKATNFSAQWYDLVIAQWYDVLMTHDSWT